MRYHVLVPDSLQSDTPTNEIIGTAPEPVTIVGLAMATGTVGFYVRKRRQDR